MGYGIVAPEYQWDDFKGIDLKGKVLVMLTTIPTGPEAFRGQDPPLLRPLDLQVRERGAAGRGGRDHHPHHARPPAIRWQVVQTSWTARSSSCPPGTSRASSEGLGHRGAAASRRRPAARISTPCAAAQKRDFKPVPLGLQHCSRSRTSLAQEDRERHSACCPAATHLDEAVIYTAHHDHLGSASPPSPARRSTTAPTTMPPAAPASWPSPRP